jgi:hypothetical protein
MTCQISGWRYAWLLLSAALCFTSLTAQNAKPSNDDGYDLDTRALLLARTYVEGGEGARAALLEALQHMGWGLRGAKGELLQAAPAGADTGLALREFELSQLLRPTDKQASLRLISFAQALAVPARTVDPEELAQGIVEDIRKTVDSTRPQARFWARFIVALGRVGPAGYDLTKPSPPPFIPPNPKSMKKILDQQLERLAGNPLQPLKNPQELMEAVNPTPIWTDNDPVLAPSPLPKRPEGDTRTTTVEKDRMRMDQISEEMGRLADEIGSGNPERMKAAQEKMHKLSGETAMIGQRMQSASMHETSGALKTVQSGGQIDGPLESRFMAEWRDQPFCSLQVLLITRVLAADLIQAIPSTLAPRRVDARRWPLGLPLAAIRVAQGLAGAPNPSFGQQVITSAGDMWATVSTSTMGHVLDLLRPHSNVAPSQYIGMANAIIAWLKTFITLLNQDIALEVLNEPLIRTKSHVSPGEERTARVKVKIDFPPGQKIAEARGYLNPVGLDLDLPADGNVKGAKVVWRILEGDTATKYQTASGGWTYNPDLAFIQFADRGGGGTETYVSTTNWAGQATIQLQGKPQKRQLPSTVREYRRRAAVGVEVTIDPGNFVKDFTDATSTASAGPPAGMLTFVAEMILRSSFFFSWGYAFEVVDWKEPAWDGEFEITVAASGAKSLKGVKGAPDSDITWKMDRYLVSRMHTPEWEEQDELQRVSTDGVHVLEVAGDTRYFRLKDASSSTTKNGKNRYEATGPIQIRPPARNQMEKWSVAQPSGNAVLTLYPGKMTLELKPFFTAECMVARIESSGGNSAKKSGTEFLNLLYGLDKSDFTIKAPYNEQDVISGEETFPCKGNLPFVPTFDVSVTVKYRLSKNNPPPRAAED